MTGVVQGANKKSGIFAKGRASPSQERIPWTSEPYGYPGEGRVGQQETHSAIDCPCLGPVVDTGVSDLSFELAFFTSNRHQLFPLEAPGGVRRACSFFSDFSRGMTMTT